MITKGCLLFLPVVVSALLWLLFDLVGDRCDQPGFKNWSLVAKTRRSAEVLRAVPGSRAI
jgi:hypothetical protein